MLDFALTELEGMLNLALYAAATPEQVSEARTKVEEQLSGYQRQMPIEMYQKTFANLLTQRLREIFGVPRLSLFHMK
jgi:hypothetical protein